MFIEQGYKGNIGLWKYWIPILGFSALMVVNYIMTINSPVDVDVMMKQVIDKLGLNVFFILAIGPLVAGFFIILGWVYLVHGQSITSLTTSRKKVDWKRVLFAFLLWGGITMLMMLADIMMSPDDYVLNFKPIPFLILLVMAIVLVPLQTSFEEYMFRGHLMQGLGIMAKNRWVPLVVTSVLFGVMHAANPEVGKIGYGIMVFYIGTGFFLGILTLMDEGLELALGFHAANNLTAALLVTADWTAFQTNSIYKDVSQPTLGWDIFIPVLVIYPILLLIFSKKYGWSNWKERLTGKVLDKEVYLAQHTNGSDV
ncbi:CPBP family intramembrane glutamic endopeptidase [Maribacter arenosus]|uniref:CPBP family intramembrane metalloprotease n=1 Tax=Maribacter arenosus TaxID=1854708 RepID=A0ABR7V7Y0_9FLAO|nr:CPBP family intramembrane glutamic endopeptidase [Maribacter arenosus]MBD0849774.1 CPBP family intramembrane metalloprotease [Maribacter arenosus]